MRAKGNLSDKLLRRYFLKRDVVDRRKRTKELALMAAEDDVSQAVNPVWNEQWRKRFELKCMAAEELESIEFNDEIEEYLQSVLQVIGIIFQQYQ